MKRMAYHLLAILILGMAASAVKAQILLQLLLRRLKNMRR